MRDRGRRSFTIVFLLHVAFCFSYGFTPLRGRPISFPSMGLTLRNHPGCLPRSTPRSGSEALEHDPEFEQVKDQQFRKRNKRWIVLVDDEESIRMAVGDYLYDHGYKVTACVDADALVEVVSMPPEENMLPIVPDVIISDIRMPGRNGLALLKYIRADKRLSRVPVVLLTAKAFTTDRIEGYNSGADVYLTKPFDPEELLAIVDNLITRRQQMTGSKGRLADLQEEMANIKQILKINGSNVVQKTDVYLTLSEREVLELVCDGMTNTDIAKRRGVTPERVGGILQQLYLKTDNRSRTELVRWALKTGYVSKRQ